MRKELIMYAVGLMGLFLFGLFPFVIALIFFPPIGMFLLLILVVDVVLAIIFLILGFALDPLPKGYSLFKGGKKRKDPEWSKKLNKWIKKNIENSWLSYFSKK